jgi:hypothetical protein
MRRSTTGQNTRFVFILAAAVATTLTVSACGSSGGQVSSSGKGGAEKVTITSPADGADVQVPFMLRWDSTVKLGPTDTGRDHVHVYVDGHSNDYTVVGANQFKVKNLSPGMHKVEISLQHADHTPVGPKSAIHVDVTGGGSSTSPSPSDSGGGGGYGY